MPTVPPSPDPIRIWLAALILGEEPSTTPEESALLVTAQAEGVLALCHDRLRRSPTWLTYPETLRSALSQQAYQAVAVEMWRATELREVLTALAQQGLSVILLKGAALAYTLYPESHLRDRCDADLLLPSRDDAERAWQVLQSLGYRRQMAIAGDLISYEFSCYKTSHGGVTHALDVHWRISNSVLFAERFSFAELEVEAIPIPELGPHARGLGPVHALLLACLHRASNMPVDTADRLIWLYDIHLLAQHLTDLQWQQITKLAVERSLCYPCFDGLCSARTWFRTFLPDTALSQLKDCAANPQWRFEWLSLRSLPSTWTRIRWLGQYLFPNIAFMREQYGFRHPLWLPWFYGVRIFRLIRRIGKLFH